MLVGKAQPNIRRKFSARAAYSCGAAVLLLLCGSRVLQNAVAEGDTRTITLHHIHTDEDITITFKREGRYDEAALEKLNWFLRDWRKQQETKMDPHLIDLVWEVQRETGSNQPILVVCGYRSPETNAMLRRRSNGVARFSQHMLGHALDFYIPGVPLEQLRVIGLRLQRGGVGFYPTSGSPFVHMDTGGIRMWPRMTRDQLVRVFPDQRTVYLPTDGRPLAGYDLALDDIKQRGGDVPTAVNVADAGESTRLNPIAKLLHLARGGSDEEDEGASATAAPAPASPPAEPLRTRAKAAVAAAIDRAEDKLATEKAKITAAAAKAGAKLAVEKTKIAQAASKVHVISRAEAAPLANTPNQVILARGFWQGVPDGNASAPSQAASSAVGAVARSGRTEVASAVNDSTGSIALAYAEETEGDGAEQAALRAALLSRAAAAIRGGDSATTVAVKRLDGRAASKIFTVSTKRLSTTLADAGRLADPWLHAIMVSPSVSRFLCITTLGARDFRSFADFMAKPASTVMMPFAADPNPGLDAGRFSGSAVVFLSTVTYPLRTAQLQ